MKYQDLVKYVADTFIDDISEDFSGCEKFSEYIDIMQMTPSEVKDEFISIADFGITEFIDENFIYVDSDTGNVTSDEFDEEVPFRTFKRDVVKLINEALK
ncbi:MAG: hypothetical protein IJE78_05985 [Bacteroidaceae bacterium]|nr:hypothetical protein [Bacteroidaceae bacterium]